MITTNCVLTVVLFSNLKSRAITVRVTIWTYQRLGAVTTNRPTTNHDNVPL